MANFSSLALLLVVLPSLNAEGNASSRLTTLPPLKITTLSVKPPSTAPRRFTTLPPRGSTTQTVKTPSSKIAKTSVKYSTSAANDSLRKSGVDSTKEITTPSSGLLGPTLEITTPVSGSQNPTSESITLTVGLSNPGDLITSTHYDKTDDFGGQTTSSDNDGSSLEASTETSKEAPSKDVTTTQAPVDSTVKPDENRDSDTAQNAPSTNWRAMAIACLIFSIVASSTTILLAVYIFHTRKKQLRKEKEITGSLVAMPIVLDNQDLEIHDYTRY